MRFVIVLAGIAFSLPVFAQDCKDAPRDAVLNIQGSPVDEWATIACSKFGHVITYTPEYGFMAMPEKRPIVFPAQIAKGKPKEGPNEFYFTSVSVRQLTGNFDEFVHELHQKNIFFSSFGEDIPNEKPKIWELEAKTNEGKLLGIYFYEYSDSTYGASCWESCTPTRGFVVLEKPN